MTKINLIRKKISFVKRKHFMILRFLIQRVRLNYIVLTVLTQKIQENIPTNEGYAQAGGGWGGDLSNKKV